jgi:single-strand selective monofunctional uracil DNA glycosylase
MAQTGVPFGDIPSVRDWMGIEADIGKPPSEHPRRPVDGFACGRREVSGQRLWGWAAKRFGSAKAFFQRFFVANYCPLCFLEDSGRNRTPDKLKKEERAPLFEACDKALAAKVDYFRPRYALGIGAFAESRIRSALSSRDICIGRILHPSPASPAANRGWEDAVERALQEMGIQL